MKRITATMAALAFLLTAASLAPAQKNTLSTEEAASGYTLLFNGTSLAGWRTWNSTTPPNSWTVVAESTWNVLRNGAGTQNPLITSDSSYTNFDLKFEFNVPSQGNAGIFIRYNQYNRDSWGGASGPETQIAAINNSDGTNSLHRNGTCYDMFPLITGTTNWDATGPSGVNYGVYHQLRIVAFNNRVAHYGNGKKIIEYNIGSSAYNTAYTASKYASYPAYKTIHQGGIYLQHHGEQNIRFRSMRVKKLTESPWANGSVYLTTPTDSNGGLKANMTFEENFFPSIVGISGDNATRNLLNTRLVRDGDGMQLILDRTGDYMVRVDDLNGRSSYTSPLRGTDRITLPARAFQTGTVVLRILSADGSSQVYSRLVASVR
jgi:hypothetical protein